MKRPLKNLWAALTASAFVWASAAQIPEAEAADWIIKDKGAHSRPHELGVLVSVPYCCGNDFSLNPGVLYGIPIVEDGFVPINDSFYLEFGAWTSLRFSDPTTFGVTPVGGVRWNFHLMEVWDAYGALRAGVNIGHGADANLHIHTAIGTTWKFSKTMGLRGEFGGGNHGGNLAVGLDFDF